MNCNINIWYATPVKGLLNNPKGIVADELRTAVVYQVKEELPLDLQSSLFQLPTLSGGRGGMAQWTGTFTTELSEAGAG